MSARVPRRAWPMLAVVTYCAAGLCLALLNRHQINPDGISYIRLAEDYLDGNWHQAVNGYWGPLYAITLVPCLALGCEPLLATKITGAFIATFALVATWFGLGKILNGASRVAITAAFGQMYLIWASTVTTPDLLMVSLGLFYLAVAADPAYLQRNAIALRVGIIAGLAYLTKAYFAPFFVVHFLALNAYLWRRHPNQGRLVCRRVVSGFAAFMALAVPWILLISVKYSTPTVGTASKSANSYSRPGGNEQLVGISSGLVPPPDGALSSWDDPSLLPAPTWRVHLFDSPHNIGHLASLVRENGWESVDLALAFLGYNGVIAGILLGSALWLAVRSGDARAISFGATGAVYVLAILIYPFGYLTTLTEDRYLWFAYAALVLALVNVVEVASLRVPACRRYFDFGTIALCASIIASHVDNLPVKGHQDRIYADLSGSLKPYIPQECRSIATNYDWVSGLHLSYYLDCPYFGALRANGASRQSAELDKYCIQYVLWWGDRQSAPRPAGFVELATTDKPQIALLRRLPPSDPPTNRCTRSLLQEN